MALIHSCVPNVGASRLNMPAFGPASDSVRFKGEEARDRQMASLIASQERLVLDTSWKRNFLQQPASVQLTLLDEMLKSLGNRFGIPEIWLPEIVIEEPGQQLHAHDAGGYNARTNQIVLNPADPRYPHLIDHEFRHFQRSFLQTQLFYLQPDRFRQAIVEGLIQEVGSQGNMFFPMDPRDTTGYKPFYMNRPDFPADVWPLVRSTLHSACERLLQTGKRPAEVEEQLNHKALFDLLTPTQREGLEKSRFAQTCQEIFNECEPEIKATLETDGLVYTALDFYFQSEYERLLLALGGLTVIPSEDLDPPKMEALAKAKISLPQATASVRESVEMLDRGVMEQSFMAYWSVKDEILARNTEVVGVIRAVIKEFPGLKTFLQNRPDKKLGFYDSKENYDYRRAHDQLPGMGPLKAALIELKRNNYLLQIKKGFYAALAEINKPLQQFNAMILNAKIQNLLEEGRIYPGMLRASIPHLDEFKDLREFCSDNSDDSVVKSAIQRLADSAAPAETSNDVTKS